MICIRKEGRIVSRSKNLRGILRYTARERNVTRYLRGVRGYGAGFDVTRVHVLQTPEGALLRVRWSDGAYAVARFASFTTARLWVQARRFWPAARVTMLHEWHAPTRED